MNQNTLPKSTTIKNKALLVLMVFCALLFLQTACSAGMVSHCDHHESHDQGIEQCDHDPCGANYPVPGKINTKTYVSFSSLAPGIIQAIPATLCDKESQLYCQPVVISSPRPAGLFPLLI